MTKEMKDNLDVMLDKLDNEFKRLRKSNKIMLDMLIETYDIIHPSGEFGDKLILVIEEMSGNKIEDLIDK